MKLIHRDHNTQPAQIPVAALYMRVSTKDKQDHTNQLAGLLQLCEKRDWEPRYRYVDRESGGKADRPQFLKMMDDCRCGGIHVVVFWSLDRLSREGVYQTLTYLQALQTWKVDFCSYTEQYLDSCGIFKDAVLSILATIAKQERVRMSERVRAGLDRVRREGRRIGRPPAVIDAAGLEKMVVAGMSVSEIARLLHISRSVVHRRIHALHEIAEEKTGKTGK